MGIASWSMNCKRQGGDAINNVGANVINMIDDPITEYYTTLFKQRTELTESVLRMMFAYRKEKFVRAALALLEGVTWIISNNSDVNNVLLKYLLSIDPPAYTCRRYWDWIEPHITQHIQHCSENPHLSGVDQELETSVRIFSNLETIKQEYGALLDPESGLCE